MYRCHGLWLVMEDNYEHVDPSVCYIPTNIPGKGCDQDLFESEPSEGCKCKNSDEKRSCSITNVGCCCLKSSANYDSKGLLINTSGPIYECWDACLCSKSRCLNRVVQKGPISYLSVKETGDRKGFGIYTTKFIPSGTFVCEYAGEVIGESEAERRNFGDHNHQQHNYIYWIRENYGQNQPVQTIIDPTVIGNIGRYLNHSCEANLAVFPVRVESLVPRIALFALRDIHVDEELTFDYGIQKNSADGKLALDCGIQKSSAGESKLKLCLCQSNSCQGKLPFHTFK